MASIADEAKMKMLAALEHLKVDLKSIRTGRANTGMLDGVSVEIYGSYMRLKELAQVTSPEPRMLLVTPFDAKNTNTISKAIERANLGINPIADGNAIRLRIPAMDESMRKEMVKLCHKRREDAKIGVRNARRDSNDLARRQKAEGTLPEDVLKKLEKTIQEYTDKYCKEADDIAAAKEKEIMTV